jgi:hypothetical protein
VEKAGADVLQRGAKGKPEVFHARRGMISLQSSVIIPLLTIRNG